MLLAIVVLAITLRIAAIAYTHGTAAAPEENRLIAANLAAGRGFMFTEFGVTGPTAIRGPVYPLFLAIVGPNRVGRILAINVLAGGATVIAAAALARRLASPLPAGRAETPASAPAAMPGVAWAAAVLFAAWPTQLYAATLTQALSMAVCLTLTALALAWRRTPGSLVAAGLLAGVAILAEPVLGLPLLLSAVVLGWRRRWSDAAAFVAASMVIIAPWLYRNAIVFGGPMPITSNFWRDACLGIGRDGLVGGIDQRRAPIPMTNAAGRNTGDDLFKRLPPRQFDRLKVIESERLKVFREWAKDSIKASPWQYAKSCFARLTVANFDHPLRTEPLFFFSYPLLGVAAGIGSRYGTHRFAWRWLALPGAFAVGLTLSTVLTRTAARDLVFDDIAILTAAALVITAHAPWRRKPISI